LRLLHHRSTRFSPTKASGSLEKENTMSNHENSNNVTATENDTGRKLKVYLLAGLAVSAAAIGGYFLARNRDAVGDLADAAGDATETVVN
jgi:hypothetical protein